MDHPGLVEQGVKENRQLIHRRFHLSGRISNGFVSRTAASGVVKSNRVSIGYAPINTNTHRRPMGDTDDSFQDPLTGG